MTEDSYLTRKLRHGADLASEDADYLNRIAWDAQIIPANTDVIRSDERTDYLHVMKSGVACRYKMLPEGGRAIVALLLPGDFCDLHVEILDTMDHSIGTLVTSEVARTPRATVKDMLKSPAVQRACRWATLVDEAVLREWLVNIGRRPTDKRLAHLFCEIYTRLQAVGIASGHRFDMPFTHITLGDLVGVTQIHVQRTMKTLRETGLLTLENGVMSFSNFEAIADFAEFDPGYLHLHRGRPGQSPPGRPHIDA